MTELDVPIQAADMNPFSGDVVVRATVRGKSWDLERVFVYENPGRLRYGKKTGPIEIPIPLGTDFASVPRPFVWLFPRYGVYTRSAILHDYLCATGNQVDRADADRIFRLSMDELEVPVARRWVMWAGVRAGGMWTAVRTGEMWRAVRSGSVLKDGRPGRAVGWLLIAVPTLLFLLVPALVISLWLVLFYVIEALLFLVLKLLGRKPNPPGLFFRTS